MAIYNEYNLTMESVVEFDFKKGRDVCVLKDIYDPAIDERTFIQSVNSWIRTGRARMPKPIDQTTKIANEIANEIMAVENGKAIEEDRIARANYNQGSHGYYGKVGFPAKTLLHAQEMHQQLMKNFYIKQDQLGVEMQGGSILVTITDCPVKTFASIERVFVAQKVTGAVTNTIDKAAGGLINATDITINSLAVPVAKTAVSTTAKVGKSVVGLAAKLGGILVSEVVKNTKQCCNEIKNDGYIAEAKGEVVDGVHTVRRAIINHTGSSMGGGQILS